MERRSPIDEMYFIIIAIVVALDQFTKYLVQANMDMGQSIPVIAGLFHMTYIKNYGAAFSILQNHRSLLIAFPLIVTVIVLTVLIKIRKSSHRILLLSISLIAGGGIGNLIDRIAYGYVVDFFDFRIWPIFNVADIAVCFGCVLLVIYVLFIEPKTTKNLMKENKQ